MAYVLLALALAGLVYQILALICLARFFSRSLPPPAAPPTPGVTVFKPLKGLDSHTRECLTSFLTQDYHPYQVLFGVADPQDPVLPLLKELQDTFTGPEVEIILCPEPRGLNPKISTLRQLEPRARYELVVISDGDVQVGPHFLSLMVAALKEPGVGLVSCPYGAGPAPTLGARLEALTIAGDFIPSVAVAHYVEGVRFALGAAMATSRQVLNRIGGLAALADFLADDYQLGYLVAQAGLKVGLLPYAVETHNPSLSLGDYLAHQLRWARTYRVCRPRGYLAYGITHTLTYSTALTLATGLAPPALGLLAATLSLRLGLAYFSERLCLKGNLPATSLLLLPLKDFLAFGLWALSFLGNRVTWQNHQFRVTPDGKLTRL
jgi:ceramide glucosyltransferase